MNNLWKKLLDAESLAPSSDDPLTDHPFAIIGPRINLREQRRRYRWHRALVFLRLRRGVEMEITIYDERRGDEPPATVD